MRKVFLPICSALSLSLSLPCASLPLSSGEAQIDAEAADDSCPPHASLLQGRMRLVTDVEHPPASAAASLVAGASQPLASAAAGGRAASNPEFIQTCTTSACCGPAPDPSAAGIHEPAAGSVWVYIFAGWEVAMFKLLEKEPILEKTKAIAHGWCITFNREVNDGSVHAQMMPSHPGACAHGTASRVSQETASRYAAAWDKMGWPLVAVNLTDAGGQTFPALAPRHKSALVDPIAAHEQAPTLSYISTTLCGMREGSYCPEYIAAAERHLADLGAPTASVVC